MARRPKRNEPKLEEAVAGFVGLIIFAVVIIPGFRNMILVFFSKLFLIALIVFLLAIFVYFLIQYLKGNTSNNDFPSSGRGITPLYHRTAPVPFRAPAPKANNPQHQFQAAPQPPQPVQPVRTPPPIQPQPAPAAPPSQPVRPIQPVEPIDYQPYQDYQQPLQPQQWDETILSIIEWKRFEVVTKEFLKMTGYDAKETKIGADGGVDIRATKLGPGGFECLVQCKAWTTYTVGIKPIRELYGVMAAEKVARGMFVNSGKFTSEAEDFAKGKILLLSGHRFLELIRKLSAEKQQNLLNIALEGDYRTPTCPQCDRKMTRRDVKKGRNIGGFMWGCVNYPKCKQTLVYKEH